MTLSSEDSIKNVAILIYDGVEILDFSGPGEVFADAGGFKVYTVALTKDPILSQGFVTVTPEFSIDDCPPPDLIVLPGAPLDVVLAVAAKPKLIDWVQRHRPNLEVALSVCTGAFILAKAGLLDGKEATTHHLAIQALREAAPKAVVLENVRWVDNGKIVTTAGVSAGIDGTLHVVDRMLGRETALATADFMEYDKWDPNGGVIVA